MSDSGADDLQQTILSCLMRLIQRKASFLGDVTAGHTLGSATSITEETWRQMFTRKSNACHCSVPNHITLEASGCPELEDGIASRERPVQWRAQQQWEWVTNARKQYG